METGTLKELNVKPGDVVECNGWADGDSNFCVGGRYKIHARHPKGFYNGMCAVYVDGDRYASVHPNATMLFRIISRASEDPKLWRDMTDDEKGALLLAHHDGKVIEWNAKSVVTGKWGIWDKCGGDCLWDGIFAYRVKPEPVQETVEMLGFIHNHEWYYRSRNDARATHRITFKTIDGKPDCSTIKMEEIEE